MDKIYNGRKNAKLGTTKRPAQVHVKTQKRLNKVKKIFEKHGWEYTIALEKEKPEDISDLEILLNPPKTRTVGTKTGRNDPCPCGSGKKFKKCCGA